MTQDIQLITAEQLAKRLSLHRETVLRLAREKMIPSIKIGNVTVRFDLSAVSKTLDRKSREMV